MIRQMVWIKIPLLVNTNTARKVRESSQKKSPKITWFSRTRTQLEISQGLKKKNPSYVDTNTPGDGPTSCKKYLFFGSQKHG